VNPQTNVIYVTRGDPNAFSYNRSYISAIDGKTNKKIQDTPLNLTPVGLSVNSQTNMLYAIGYGYYPDFDSYFVSVIDGRTNKVVDDIPVDFETTGISVNPKTNMIYVTGGDTNSSLGYVAAIDGETNKVVNAIELDEYGNGISVNPQTDMIYSIGYDTVYTIAGNTKTYKHPTVGINGIDVNEQIASTMKLNTTKGFLVTDTIPGGPASKAGIEGGDKLIDINGRTTKLFGDVIIKIDNQSVSKIDDIRIYLDQQKKVGQGVDLTVIRDGKLQTVKVVLEKRPMQMVNSTISDSQTKGISVNPQTNMIYVLGQINTILEFTYPTVSVIDGDTNNEISDIQLKQTLSSEFIDLNPETSMIYVLSFDSKTVSVLSHSKPESPLTLVR